MNTSHTPKQHERGTDNKSEGTRNDRQQLGVRVPHRGHAPKGREDVALEAVHQSEPPREAHSRVGPSTAPPGHDEHRDARPRRERRSRPNSDHRVSATDAREVGTRVVHAFAEGQAHLLRDNRRQVIAVQLLDSDSQRVLREISAENLASHEYQGLLVDLET